MNDEGLRLQVYDDATGKPLVPGSTLVGHPTIGIGRALDTNGITKEEASFLFQGDVLRVTAMAQKFSWFPGLSEPRQAVVICMIFNMGMGEFQRFQQMITALAGGDFAEAGSQMLDSVWAKQLPTRSQNLARIMVSGIL